MQNKRVGLGGEVVAVEYLKSIGYAILETNFLSYVGEVDIICQDKTYVVFVEVKARNNYKFGRPIEAITPSKVRAIRKTAQSYLVMKGWHKSDVRFDVIEIMNGEILEHTKNAF